VHAKSGAVGQLLSNFAYQIKNAADQSSRYSERQFKLFGAIAVFLIPLTAFIERVVADSNFDTLYLRILAGAAGLPLLFHDKLPKALQKHREAVWIISISVILPFFYGAILTINAALTEPGSAPSPIWVYQYIVALFIFIQLTNHGPLSFVLWIASALVLFLLCLMMDSPNHEALLQVWLFPLPVYLTALFIGSITNRNRHIVQSEQLRAASAIGSNIAHELRTPLASIRAFAHGIARFLPDLADGYQLAAKAGLTPAPMPESKLAQLKDGVASIQNEVDYSNTIIDMLLVNTSENRISPQDFQLFCISQVIEDAVARFPFNNSDERKLVNYSVVPDFRVNAPRLFVVHVLFNLMKNGLYYVQRGGKGSLSISTAVGSAANIVVVTDTGPGIPASLKHQIFDRFFSTIRYGQGAGIGLSFCKMVMESIGGEIQCESREGEYTTFRLIFPPAGQMQDQVGTP
jgi:two-component system, CAI-1 autoinducer sensor kinase/phosphatase CqsS